MKFKMKVMQYDKGMGAYDIARAISKAQGIPKVDRIPPDYMPEKEVLIFVVVDGGKKLDQKVENWVHFLSEKSSANIAFIGVGVGSTGPMNQLADMAKKVGINVAGVYEVPVKGGLFKKGKASEADIKGAVDFAAKTVDSI